MSSRDSDNLKVRHFLLQTKVLADTNQRPERTPSVTDAEICELLESIWIAERASEDPGADLAALARAYRPQDWVTRDTSPKAMERALSRASAFYDSVSAGLESLLV